jgi:hypothetical protein
LYTENQLPRLSGSGQKVCGGGWVVVGYTPIALSHQLRFWLKLGCDNLTDAMAMAIFTYIPPGLFF